MLSCFDILSIQKLYFVSYRDPLHPQTLKSGDKSSGEGLFNVLASKIQTFADSGI